MQEKRGYVGVDVSKDRLDMAVSSTGEIRSFGNQDADIGEATIWLRQVNPAIIVMEATGGMEVLLYVALQEANLPVAFNLSTLVSLIADCKKSSDISDNTCASLDI